MGQPVCARMTRRRIRLVHIDDAYRRTFALAIHSHVLTASPCRFTTYRLLARLQTVEGHSRACGLCFHLLIKEMGLLRVVGGTHMGTEFQRALPLLGRPPQVSKKQACGLDQRVALTSFMKGHYIHRRAKMKGEEDQKMPQGRPPGRSITDLIVRITSAGSCASSG